MSGSSAALDAALEQSQRLGFLGARPIAEVIAHARGFVRALDDHPGARTILDLGAGGGVPGLVIANDRPDLRLTLLDRRAKRTDFLEQVVRRLGWTERVTVICIDVDDFGPDEPFDAVVARGFGPPDVTLTAAVQFVRPGGLIVISEPPNTDRWDRTLLERLGLERTLPAPPGQHVPGKAQHRDDGGIEGLVAIFRSM